jgi:DNA-binding NtrC family response regulator
LTITQEIWSFFRATLAHPDIEILTASDPEQALEPVASRHPQIVLTDLVMPGMTGLEVLERVMEMDPSTDVILMTAHYSTETAVEAIKKGATNYLNKPASIAAIREKIGKLIENAKKRQKALQLQDEMLQNAEFEGIVGNSPLMWEMFPGSAESPRTTAPCWSRERPGRGRT